LTDLEVAGDVDHDGMAMRRKPAIRGQFACANLESKPCRTLVSHESALSHVGRALCELSDQSKDSGSHLSTAAHRISPLHLDDVCAALVLMRAAENQSIVSFAPRRNMRQKMKVGLLGDPPVLT